MPYRILHIIDAFQPAGAAAQLALLVRGLPRTEYESHVCALDDGGPIHEQLAAAGIPVTTIGNRRRIDPPAFSRLQRLLTQFQPDLIQTWGEPASRYGRLAAWASGVGRWIKVAEDRREVRTWFGKKLDKCLDRRTSAVIVNTLLMGERCNRELDPGKVHLVVPGVLPPEGSSITRESLLAELGLPAGVLLAATVGRLEAHERLKDVIWAADLLKVIRADVHLVIIGEGPHRARLERFREQVRIRDKVHFLGARNDIARILPHCNLLWQASERETVPQSILEAMAAGVPVVASDIPAHRMIVSEGKTGYRVPPGDRAALARAANRIFNDPALALRLSETACECARRDFSAERMLTRYKGVYRDVLNDQ